MNVLPFVMTMLMLLSIMTYARIESFRDLSGLMPQFEWYMQKSERTYNNEINDKKYNKQNPSKRVVGDDPESKQKDEEKACSRIPFSLFINKQQRESKQEFFDQHVLLAKIVINQLYGNADFFKDAEQLRPDLVDSIIKSLMYAADKLPKKQSIISGADLSSIDLGDKTINDTFTDMLKGTVTIEGQDVKETYPALIDYITVKNKTKVRIFLAPREILMAIYDSPELVNEIMEERVSLYKQVKDESISKDEASSQFESHFGGKQRHGLDAKVLDFRVTKTNPKDYS